MKYNKYLLIIVTILVFIMVGQLIVMIVSDFFPQLKTGWGKPPQKATDSGVTKASTPYSFFNYNRGNYYTYTNDKGIKKLLISLLVRGKIIESHGLYMLPVSILNSNFNLILGNVSSKVLFSNNYRNELTLKVIPFHDLALQNKLKEKMYVRISIPLTEPDNKNEVVSNGKCNETCKKNIELIEKQINPNRRFEKLIENNSFPYGNKITDIGPIFDLIIIN